MKNYSAKMKSIFTLLSCLLVVAMCLPLFAACGGDNITDDFSTPGDNTSVNNGEKVKHTVNLQTIGGMPLSEIDVYIYSDAEKTDMKDFGKTDTNGNISFNLASGVDYVIVLSGVPKGYDVKDIYSFSGTTADITLTSSLIKDELSTAKLKVGDVMYDFTVNTIDGEEFVLSEVLSKKKMVMLNFWYSTCGPCVSEFPVISEVYELYKDDIEIIALNNLTMDRTVETVRAFQDSYQLPFKVATCPVAYSNAFDVTGYPTSVFVDQYGVICLIEVGAVTSKRPWISAFDHFTAENYKQKFCLEGIGELVSQVKPTYTMDSSEEVGAIVNNGDIQVTYRPETEDENAEMFWPFIKGEKLGNECIYASNKGIDDSYAIMYADVTLKAGQALGLDYLASSELLSDVMYIIVDGEDVFTISGVDENEEWKSCYPLVADKDGTYEVAFCFIKDSDAAEGDDTVYIDNFRIVNASDIDTDTYLPRYAAVANAAGTYDYVTVVFNEADGYYHVGSENGPLLLADLMNYCQFNEEQSVYEIVYNGDADKDGVSLYDNENGLGMVDYFTIASNSALSGVCTVNKELGDMLKQVAEVAGFDGDANEWLKICKYYESYGPNATQLQDPIKGLATFSAYQTVVGKDVETNYFYYDRIIMPRGSFSEFIPEKSGVYRFTSKSDYQDGIDAWVFNDKQEVIYTYEHDERMYLDDKNCSIVYYMEAGTPYYINMAFWDVYATGYIYYDVEYLGSSYELFRMASPGYFTYDSDATGEVMYDVIAGGITPVLKDGKYYDSEDNSLIYADFTGLTGVFSSSITQMIDMGGFDFSKSETDGEILAYLKQHDNDVDATKEYLRDLWGDEYDANAENYQLDDVFAGRYHGAGEDYTEEMRSYLSKVIKSNDETDGCVVVDERLAEILHLLVDKYTFEDVENSWLKVCYYYDYLGPAK